MFDAPKGFIFSADGYESQDKAPRVKPTYSFSLAFKVHALCIDVQPRSVPKNCSLCLMGNHH